MKIAIFNTLYHPNQVGGAEISVQLLTEELVKQGVKVKVITTYTKNEIKHLNSVEVEYVNTNNIYWAPKSKMYKSYVRPIWHFIDTYNPFYLSKLKKILRDFDPDIIHTNNLSGFSTIVWKAAHQLEYKIVHTLRDYYLLCPRSNMYKNDRSCNKQCNECLIYSFPRKKLSKYVSGVIGISNFILQKHIKFGYFKTAHYRNSIANSVSNNRTKPTGTLSSKVVVFGYIGRLSQEKGIEILLQTILQLPESDKWRLLIAGKGDSQFTNYLKVNFQDDRIGFLGHIPPKAFFDKIDFLVVPSQWEEPFARVIIEAYSYGLNVIGSDVGGIAEILEDKRLLFKTKEDLLKIISKIILMPKIFKLQRINKTKYDVSSITKQYIQFYQQILE